jgi:hypothetical protein
MEYPPGWTCEKAVVQFEFYLVSRVQLRDALAIAEHLEACPSCGQELVFYRVKSRGKPGG